MLGRMAAVPPSPRPPAQRFETTGNPDHSESGVDHLGIERGPSSRHTGDRVGERLDLANSFLEQIADALGTLREEVDGVRLLIVP